MIGHCGGSIPKADRRYDVGANPIGRRTDLRYVAFPYTTARDLRFGPSVVLLSSLSAGTALPPLLLVAGRPHFGAGLGHAQTAHAHAAAPLTLLDRAAHDARRLLECRRAD